MLVVWKKDNNNYYYRFVNGFYCNYEVGYLNRYGHEVILIIEFSNTPKVNLRQKLIYNLIGFLKKRI